MEDPSFLRYWYSADVSNPGLPPGDHELVVTIDYEWYDEAGQLQTGVLTEGKWSNLGVHQDVEQETTFTIEFPDLKKPPVHKNNENAVIWVFVYWDGALLDKTRYVVNFALMEVNRA